MVQRLTTWSRQFTFQGKKLHYNRISYNNRAERAVEVPIAFDFLARQQGKDTILEVGNVLQHYENSLSDALGIRARRIVDKFEIGHGITNLDIMDMDPEEKYQVIISVSTIEHVGQNCAPTGQFGEKYKTTDLEAPLKAIAKIYDLLAPDGHALITIPFGQLTDGGWYIQFSSEYLDLLITKYGLPQVALSVNYLKRAAIEYGLNNPNQEWIEAQAEELKHVKYDTLWGGARAVAIIELTKTTQPFSLNVALPPTPLVYESSQLAKGLFFTMGLLLKWFQ